MITYMISPVLLLVILGGCLYHISRVHDLKDKVQSSLRDVEDRIYYVSDCLYREYQSPSGQRAQAAYFCKVAEFCGAIRQAILADKDPPRHITDTW